MADKGKREKKQSNTEKPISLKPLEFDEVMADMLKVKPEAGNKRKPRKEVGK